MILTATKHQQLVDALQNLLMSGDWIRPGGIQRLNLALTETVAAIEQLDPADQDELVPLMKKMTAWDKAIGRCLRYPTKRNARAIQDTQKTFADVVARLFERSLAAEIDNKEAYIEITLKNCEQCPTVSSDN